MRSRSALLFLAVAGLAASVAADDRALFVGVGAYQNGINPLPGIDKDVENMKEVARKLGFKDAQMKSLMDKDATREAIGKSIKSWLTDGVGAKDRVFFYYSGHGTRVRDSDGDEADGFDEAIVPVDTKRGENGPENLMLDDELGPLLSAIPAARVYAFIDSCHSGTLTRSMGGDLVGKFVQLDDGFSDDDKRVGKALEDGAVADGEIGKAISSHLVMVTAANEKQQAQATRGGSLFTLGVLDAVDHAQAEHRPLSANEIQENSAKFIADDLTRRGRPQLIHTPTIDGNPELASTDVFKAVVAATPAPTAAPTVVPTAAAAARPVARPAGSGVTASATTGAAPATESVWAQLEALTRKATYKVSVAPGQSTYKVDQKLSVTVNVAEDGYLNVLNVGEGEGAATVLFPNKFQKENAVKAGTKVTIPGDGAPFALPASIPAGTTEQKTLILVVHSKKPLNAYEAGSGSGFLKELSPAATRSFSVVAAAPAAAAPVAAPAAGSARPAVAPAAAPAPAGGYGAALLYVVIRK